jgi:hypothetical protein
LEVSLGYIMRSKTPARHSKTLSPKKKNKRILTVLCNGFFHLLAYNSCTGGYIVINVF